MTSTETPATAVDIAREAVRNLTWHRSVAGSSFFAFTATGDKIVHLPGAGSVPSLFLAERASGARVVDAAGRGGWANALAAFLTLAGVAICDVCDAAVAIEDVTVDHVGGGHTLTTCPRCNA